LQSVSRDEILNETTQKGPEEEITRETTQPLTNRDTEPASQEEPSAWRTEFDRFHPDTSKTEKHDERSSEIVKEASKKEMAEDTMKTADHLVADATRPKGVTFVDAIINPMDHELNDRFWGWRSNDLIKLTDNINNFQLGILEVTRRTSMILSDSISRTGSAASLDPNIEEAINCFMIRADKFWFPSAESKYKQGIKELKIYREKLICGQANFYTRSDNLIPLLDSFQQLLGSCDQNLVKTREENGDNVSWFKADNYLYYSKGVAYAMTQVLKAIHVEFYRTIVSRSGEEVLHHAIISCERAIKLDPWIVLESSPNSILANHRANLASSISHARFYLDVLQETLST
jgi:hypothetical protein